MGRGFWILIWDGWTGFGLNVVNPRLLTDADGNNYFSTDGAEPTHEMADKMLNLNERFADKWKLIEA